MGGSSVHAEGYVWTARAAAQAVFIGALAMFMANWLSHEDDQNSTKEVLVAEVGKQDGDQKCSRTLILRF